MEDQISFKELVERISRSLEASLGRLPANFCSGFEYTRTGRNFTHPIIVAELAQIVRNETDVIHVGVDAKLNWPGDEYGSRAGEKCKLQPDVVGFDVNFQPQLFVDYESPNSSDERIIEKDIKACLRWRKATNQTVPYVLITTLPSAESLDWEVRYTSDVGYGAAAKGQAKTVRESPLRFWTNVWKVNPAMRNLNNIAILNIDCRSVAPLALDC
jgi:hypothetical protein